MTKYLALLRGINVGGKHKVEMAKLRQLCEKMSLNDVKTYINSGNLIFESKDKAAVILPRLEAQMAKSFGFAIPTVLREAKNIEKLLKVIPEDWSNDAEQKTDVLFVWEEFDKKQSLALLKPVKGVDELIYVSGAIIWHIDRKNYNKSAMHKFIGTAIYKKMTARNVNTVRKLATLMAK